MKQIFYSLSVFLVLLALIFTAPVPAFASDTDDGYEAAKDNFKGIYDKALKRAEDDQNEIKNEGYGKWFYGKVIKFYDGFSKISFAAAGTSVVLGILIYMVSRRNKRVQRFAVVFFCFLLPVSIIGAYYGIGASPLFANR